MIYGLQGNDGTPIKIGFSKYEAGAWGRMKSLQTGYPYKLRMLFIVEGEMDLEHAAHKLLAAYRLEGEWFEASPRVVSFVKACQSGGIEEGLKRAADDVRCQENAEAGGVWISEGGAIQAIRIPGNQLALIEARKRGDGPPFVEMARPGHKPSRFYRVGDIRAWLAAQNLCHDVMWPCVMAYARATPGGEKLSKWP